MEDLTAACRHILSEITNIVTAKGPTAIMLIGLPASGKSVFTEILRRRMDLAVISIDPFRELICKEMGISYPDSMVDNVNWKWESRNRAIHVALTQVMEMMAFEACAAGKSIVWDRTNLTREQRRERFATTPGYYRVGIHIISMPERVASRCAERELVTGRPIIPSVLEKMLKQFETPEPGEFDLLLELSHPFHVPQTSV